MKSHVLFSSNKFDNSSEVDNTDTNYGEDLATYLVSKLSDRTFEVEQEPIQEDWGWVILFNYYGKKYWLGIGSYQDEGIENGWLCFVEVRESIWNKLFGKKAEADLEVLKLLNQVLCEDKKITDIRWYEKSDWMNGEIHKYESHPN